MLMELDYETVSALESALIVAEDSKMRDAKDWANIAESLGASEQRRAADNLAAFCGGQANSYRKACLLYTSCRSYNDRPRGPGW